jgi:hypothetical protein
MPPWLPVLTRRILLLGCKECTSATPQGVLKCFMEITFAAADLLPPAAKVVSRGWSEGSGGRSAEGPWGPG